MPKTLPARVMIASDDAARMQQIAELLARNGMPVSEGLEVPLRMAADRASRTNPDVLLMQLTGDLEQAVGAVREARQTCAAYIIAVGPADDPRMILKCLHGGADEYLDVALVVGELTSAMARFETKRRARGGGSQGGKVISVIGASGGVGTSTIAANIAGVLAKAHKQCGLIDLRLQAGDQAALLNLKPTHTLADFCVNAARVDQSMFEQMFARHASGIELLAAPWDAGQAPLVTSQNLRLLLALARRKFPYIVLDVDNRPDDLHTEALWQADEVLVVTRLDFVSVRNARRLLDRLLSMGIESERIRLVANRYGQHRELPVGQAQSALGVKIENFVVNDPGRVNRCANEGQLVAIHSTWSSISRNLSGLAASVNGRKT
jgi:pilus assembly protein CpaE